MCTQLEIAERMKDMKQDIKLITTLKKQRDELLDAAKEILSDFNRYGAVLQQGDNGEYGTESSIGRLASAITNAEK